MRRPGVSTLLLILAVFVLAVPSTASAVRLKRVAGGFDSPVHATASPRGSALYVVEQEGQIWRVGGGHRRLFLDIRNLVSFGGERGLFSIAFPPNYGQSRYFYVNYTDNGGDVRVARFRAIESFDRGRKRTRKMLIDVEHSGHSNHNGGQVVFGPNGRLYVSVGDGGGGCDPNGNAQDLSSRKGKLLSIDTGTLSGGWRVDGYGLRNPWRVSFDRSTGRLYIGDVGQSHWEEIDSLRASRLGGTPENYMWDRYEGRALSTVSGCSSNGLMGPGANVRPIDVYRHSKGCSVTGGHVYRGRQLPSRLRGWYFFSDYCSGRIWRMKVNPDTGQVVRRTRLVRNTSLNVSSFGERRNGELLVVSRGGGIYKIAR
jgi:glucose/arabinose dehydrogenase